MSAKKLQTIGTRHGKLVVVDFFEYRGTRRYFLAVCDCGGMKIVEGSEIRQGRSRNNCGCIKKKSGGNNKTHGQSKTRLFRIWTSMKSRCGGDDPLYGGKGITVCDEWQDFVTFRDWALQNGYGDELTIDRIDGDKDYEPSNCRWATAAQQTRNRKETKLDAVKVLEIRSLFASGLSKYELARRYGVSPPTIYDAITGRRWRDLR